MHFNYLLLLLCFLFSVSPDKHEALLPPPPGGAPLTRNLYLDQTEVANIHWLEYLYYLRKDSGNAHYTAALPDTTVWDEMDVTGYLKTNYLRASAYRFHPVVGISYEQAIGYCKWRSEAASAAFNADKKLRKKYKLKDQEVRFTWRLPTAAEWELAARAAWQQQEQQFAQQKSQKKAQGPGYSIIDSKGNNRPDQQEALQAYLQQHPDPDVNCLKPFGDGLYYGFLQPVQPQEPPKPGKTLESIPDGNLFGEMIGNVAEMTAEEGTAKGGSWANYLHQVSLEESYTYTKPTAWLGFRAVCEVVVVDEGE